MGFTSFSHWIVVLLIVLILFGAGKLPRVMGELGSGLRQFRQGLKGEEEKEAEKKKALEDHKPSE